MTARTSGRPISSVLKGAAVADSSGTASSFAKPSRGIGETASETLGEF